MAGRKSPKELSKFLSYVLGRRPDEFGLVPEPDGFVKIKELLKALHEEEGWRHVRRALIDEILIVIPDPPIEMNETHIRAICRDKLPGKEIPQELPKLLFTCVSRKSHPFVLEKGIFPTDLQRVILSSEKEMAERIGRRRDKEPVLLTINVQQAEDGGVVFYKSGDLLFYSDFIPADCFAGPSVPKKKPEVKKKETHAESIRQHTPGSFDLNLGQAKDKKNKKKNVSWKRDRKRLRREKRKKWPG